MKSLVGGKRWGIATLFMCFLLNGDYASAQEAVLPDEGGQKTYMLQSIVVTAQKKEEDVQEIPFSVAVFPERMIESAGIKNTLQLQRYTPNVFVKDTGTYQSSTIRGVGGFVTSMHQATALYVDDINMPLVYQSNQELFDIERVEILKGPQGTLYGRNSEAGVINIVTRQPDNTARGKIMLDGSLWDTTHGASPAYQIGASASGPIVEDKLFFSFSGKWDYDHGTIKNEFTSARDVSEVKRIQGRGQVRWTPNENLDISLLADINNSYDGMADGYYPTGPYGVDYNHVNREDDDYTRHWYGNSQSLRVKYSGDNFDVLSITGRRYFGDEANWDFDSTPIPIVLLDLDATQYEQLNLWSQEFRLSSSPNSDSPFSWLVGTYAFSEQLDVGSGQLGTGTYPVFPATAPSVYQEAIQNRDTQVETLGIAFFGQGTYTFFDKLHLTAGLRYDTLEQKGSQDFLFTYKRPSDGIDMDTLTKFDDRLINSELLPKLSIAYDFNDNIMAYATVSKGYLAGGFNWSSAVSDESFTYNSEYTWNYELGVKTSWFDNRLTVNAAAFYIDMTDKQVTEVINNGTAVNISNAGQADSIGAELEVQAILFEGLTTYANIGYTQTKVTKWFDPTNNIDYAGKELPYAPRLTYSLGAMYQHISGVYGRADLIGTGAYYYDPSNDVKEPSYETVNMRLGYAGENYDISVYCNNLFNRQYYTLRQPVAGFGILSFDGDPREFGITIQYTF